MPICELAWTVLVMGIAGAKNAETVGITLQQDALKLIFFRYMACVLLLVSSRESRSLVSLPFLALGIPLRSLVSEWLCTKFLPE